MGSSLINRLAPFRLVGSGDLNLAAKVDEVNSMCRTPHAQLRPSALLESPKATALYVYTALYFCRASPDVPAFGKTAPDWLISTISHLDNY